MEMEHAAGQKQATALDTSGLLSLLSSQIHKFDGAHHFAGHKDTLVQCGTPRQQRRSEGARCKAGRCRGACPGAGSRAG